MKLRLWRVLLPHGCNSSWLRYWCNARDAVRINCQAVAWILRFHLRRIAHIGMGASSFSHTPRPTGCGRKTSRRYFQWTSAKTGE